MKEKLYFIISMLIFGAVGIFAKYIHLSSAQIAWCLSLIGCLCLLLILLSRQHKNSRTECWRNRWLLFAASITLSGNWIFLFQAYKTTTIANAALSYYAAPIFVILASPLLFDEKLAPRKLFCVGIAFTGLCLILQNGTTVAEENSLEGMAYGLCAAAFYAALTVLNKYIHDLDGLTRTFCQLAGSAAILTAYLFITGEHVPVSLSSQDILLLFILGICHGGLGFYLFFTSLCHLDGQTVAILSYVDPLTSLLISVCFLQEPMGSRQVMGATLLLGALWFAERSESSCPHTAHR